MAGITMDEALARYAAECGPVTKSRNLRIIRRYLETGHTYADESLAAYLREMARDGYRIATIDLHRRIIRAFWSSLQVRPPKAPLRFDAQQDSDRPALAPDMMRTLITAAADPRQPLSAYQRAVVAVAVTYGPRANELAAIQDRDVDREARRLYIRASKKGRPRSLWIPPGIAPLLDIAWPTVTVAHVERQFGTIWAVVFDTEKPKGIAWHSVRRALVRDLVQAGIPDGAIGHFMRWSSHRAGEFAMVDLYGHPNQETTPAGTTLVSSRDTGAYAEDALVWDRHPYITAATAPTRQSTRVTPDPDPTPHGPSPKSQQTAGSRTPH